MLSSSTVLIAPGGTTNTSRIGETECLILFSTTGLFLADIYNNKIIINNNKIF
jgi:hypothetical protein